MGDKAKQRETVFVVIDGLTYIRNSRDKINILVTNQQGKTEEELNNGKKNQNLISGKNTKTSVIKEL